EFMVKLRADAALSEVDLRPEIRRQIERHQEKLAHYRTIEERDFLHGDALTREARIQHMILKKGILYEEVSIGWAQEMLEVLA
ncbi:MAG TPA: PadR family transcriptional regulator, partial [Noviherbaspirillum sp.]|nr:PadR family transcriptional regulator [Noviherbaspirillum sp.]